MIFTASKNIRLSASEDIWWIECLHCNKPGLAVWKSQFYMLVKTGCIQVWCKHCASGHFLLPTHSGKRVLRFQLCLDARDASSYPDSPDHGLIQGSFPKECWSHRKNGDKRRSFSQAERRKIWKKTEGRCYLCGQHLPFDSTWDVDHKLPLEGGGSNHFENLAPAHVECNAEKYTMTPMEYEHYKELAKPEIALSRKRANISGDSEP